MPGGGGGGVSAFVVVKIAASVFVCLRSRFTVKLSFFVVRVLLPPTTGTFAFVFPVHLPQSTSCP
jgi:hypothetical protein